MVYERVLKWRLCHNLGENNMKNVLVISVLMFAMAACAPAPHVLGFDKDFNSSESPSNGPTSPAEPSEPSEPPEPSDIGVGDSTIGRDLDPADLTDTTDQSIDGDSGFNGTPASNEGCDCGGHNGAAGTNDGK